MPKFIVHIPTSFQQINKFRLILLTQVDKTVTIKSTKFKNCKLSFSLSAKLELKKSWNFINRIRIL
nr:MAG TPA: hypothetical protein [Caudoviricetes sp.]